MKYAFAFCALFLSYSGYTQFYVGDTKDAAKAALIKAKIKFKEARLTDTTYRFSWMDQDKYEIILVFNANNTVIQETIIPEKDEFVNGVVKWFNRDLVVVSDTEWKHYANGTIYKVQLSYILNEPLFTISPGAKPNG